MLNENKLVISSNQKILALFCISNTGGKHWMMHGTYPPFFPSGQQMKRLKQIVKVHINKLEENPLTILLRNIRWKK